MGHIPSRELRKRLREGGKKWKDVERMAAKARKETEPFLAELAGMAEEVERAARRLSRSLIEPVGHRPFEAGYRRRGEADRGTNHGGFPNPRPGHGSLPSSRFSFDHSSLY